MFQFLPSRSFVYAFVTLPLHPIYAPIFIFIRITVGLHICKLALDFISQLIIRDSYSIIYNFIVDKIYAPFSIQEILVRIRYADANIILTIPDLLDFNISRAGRYDNDFLISGTFVFVVNATSSLALSTVTMTNTAAVFRSIGIHHPITTDFL